MAAHRSKSRSWEDISAETIRSVVPPPQTRVEETEDKDSSAFQIHLQSVDGVYRPDVGESSAQLQYQLRVSLYDIMYHTFFGRTWVGPARAAKVDKAKQKYKLQYQQPIYFHTSLKDPNIAAVVEVVGILEPSPGSSQPRRQMSCGWSLLRLFQKSQKLKDTSEGTADVRKLDVYHGSPRALMLMDDAIETNENIQLVKGCQIAFSLSTHQAMEKILHLVPENVLVGGNDVIPGIQEQRSKGKENACDNLLKPKLLKTLQSHLDNISITPEPSLAKFEEDLCKKTNDDRLQRDIHGSNVSLDNIGPSDGSTVNVVERRLQIGLHNGWGYVQKPQVVILAPEVETQGRARSGSIGKGHRRTPSFGSKSSLGNSSCLVARSQVQLSDLAQDASFAVVFQVEYTLSVPFAMSGAKLSGSMSRAQTITVPVLWVSWCPFTASGRPEVTVTMRCGSAPNPDNVMMFCQKSGAEQQNAGSLKFTFRRDDEPPRPMDAQDQIPNQMLQIPGQPYAASVHSETSDGSFMQERPTTVSSRPPLPSSAKSSPRTEHRLPAYSTPLPGSLPPPLSYPTISLPYPQSHTTPPHMLGDTTMDTSDGQPDTARTEDMTELTELPYTPVHAPILLSARGTQSGQGLSRAAYARLYTAGFPPITDRHGQSPEVVDPGDHVTVNLKQEEADPLQSNEIIFQFLAFSKMLSAQPSGSATSQPSTVFFTLQFYRFPPLITERLLLGAADKQLTSDPGSMPCILYRINKDGTVVQSPPGCQTKYHIDPSFLKPGEARLFVQFLSVQTLHIDVWDGDSLLLIGSCAMDLKHLCRQGREAVQVTHELDVITTEYSEDTPTLTGDLTRGGSVRPVGVSTLLKGRLHLRMANVGHLQDKARGDGAVTVPKPPSRVVPSASSHIGPAATNTSNGSPLMKQKTSCAKRLAETDNELALVLTARKDPNITQLASLDTGGELDSVRKRKLARMQAVRQTQGCEKDLNTVNTVLLQKEEKAQRNRDLRTVELYREQTKHDGITSMLSQVITTHYTVFPSLGTAEFFEFVLKNPYNVEHTITVDSDSPQLSIVTDVREWRQFKQAHNLNTPLEESMFGTTSVSGLPAIFLRPRESVYVPFKYQSLQTDHTVQPQGPSDTMIPSQTTQLMAGFRPTMHHSRNIKVYFRAADHRPVSILTVNISPQPHVVDQTFRFYHPEQSFLKKAIRLPPYHQLQDNELALVLTARKDPNITQLASLDTGGELDSVRKRKLARMQAVRQTQGCEKDLNTVNTVLLQKEEKAQRNRDLRTVELYREQTKHDGITSMLSQVITTHYTVFPSLGTAEFFEFVLKNPYNVEHTITVDSDSPQLSIVTDVREWRQFKQAHNLNTPLEESMFGTTSVSGLPAIFLRPRESVYVPFKYQSLQTDHTVQPQGPSDTMIPSQTTQLMAGFRPTMHHSRNIKVYFRAADHRPVSILTVNISPQPHVVDQTFRFYHPEQSFLKKAIRLPPYHQLQGAVVTAGGFTSVSACCSDPNVICETRKVKAGEPQDVFLKVACGPSPSVKKFFVIIYTDPHQSKPCQIWQFYLHALQRVDISCVEGQTSRFSLILRGTNASRLVRVFPSHPTEIQVSPDTPFMLAANAVHEVNVGVRPLSVGSKFLYINVVDTEYHQLIRTWLICVQTKEAVISKAFDLQLPIGGGKGCNKRIPYTNPYMHRKTFILHTNRQDLLQFKENTFELGSGDVYTIGMRFAPSQQQGTTNILIFINDEDDKNEETFCIKANYS